MKKKIKFGLAIPTGTEGLMVNLPYASARDVVELSVLLKRSASILSGATIISIRRSMS